SCKIPWQCGMMLRLQFNNRVALSSCNRPIKRVLHLNLNSLIRLFAAVFLFFYQLKVKELNFNPHHSMGFIMLNSN
ncbi:hypothetical protein, partial [Pseudomonas sp. FSL W5-0203]|uniref:hypothetical protein n=1 Tax=Pseudomonas sp. FSL W5-0203 TaxID=1920491 RepID=UPI001C452BA6